MHRLLGVRLRQPRVFDRGPELSGVNIRLRRSVVAKRFSCEIEAIAGLSAGADAFSLQVADPAQRPRAIDLNAFHSHRNLKLGLGESLIYPLGRSHVTVIPADGDLHVGCTGNLVVCGVKPNPTQSG